MLDMSGGTSATGRGAEGGSQVHVHFQQQVLWAEAQDVP